LLKASYFLLISCLFSSCWSAEATVPKPNIVLFYADDLGWMDIAIQGSNYYETPNIDRIALEGMHPSCTNIEFKIIELIPFHKGILY